MQSNAQKKTGAMRGDQNRLIFDQGFSFSGYERDSLYVNREGKKVYVTAKTIITPAARDLGEEKDVFAKV